VLLALIRVPLLQAFFHQVHRLDFLCLFSFILHRHLQKTNQESQLYYLLIFQLVDDLLDLLSCPINRCFPYCLHLNNRFHVFHRIPSYNSLLDGHLWLRSWIAEMEEVWWVHHHPVYHNQRLWFRCHFLAISWIIENRSWSNKNNLFLRFLK